MLPENRNAFTFLGRVDAIRCVCSSFLPLCTEGASDLSSTVVSSGWRCTVLPAAAVCVVITVVGTAMLATRLMSRLVTESTEKARHWY